MPRIKNWKLVRKTPKSWTKKVRSLKEWKNKKTGERVDIRQWKKDKSLFVVTPRDSVIAFGKRDAQRYSVKYMKRNR